MKHQQKTLRYLSPGPSQILPGRLLLLLLLLLLQILLRRRGFLFPLYGKGSRLLQGPQGIPKKPQAPRADKEPAHARSACKRQNLAPLSTAAI